jgi:sigma-54 dependent transcriptional regulator, acetoin dehydrogenase operon transcriptional activator AcoR
LIAELQQIKDVVQEVAEAIASALKMEVEIFDRNLVVIGATGRIRSKIGFKQETSHVSKYSLETGTSCIIEKPGEHHLCSNCKIKSDCFCTAALVCPINRNGVIMGTISLLSFNKEQRSTLLSRQGQFLDFMARMGELLAGRALLNEALNQLASSEKHLKTTIDSVSEGILAVDTDNNISYINKAAEKLLNAFGEKLIGKPVRNYFPGSPLPSIINSRKPLTRGEISYRLSDHEHNFAFSAYPIILENSVIGAVKIFRNIDDIVPYADNFARRHEAVTFENILGESIAIKGLIEKAKIVASSRSTVLLLGESGTGKELFAKAIHQASPYKNRTFQAINCSAIPESLLESELFGYEEGAFTGARKGGKPGRFELADGGTLFLDEIGDMPLYLQSKLLRVLENNTLERIGGTRKYSFVVRIIAATNQNLELMVKEGRFRNDLFYRLNVIPLLLPSLRERQDDIMCLIKHLLEKYCFLLNKNIIYVDEEVEEILFNYNWPGNVRELENVVEYAVNFEQTGQLTKSSLPRWITEKQELPDHKTMLKNKTRQWEHSIIESMIEEYGTSLKAKKAIAKQLGISITTLYRKLNKIESLNAPK